MELEMNSYRLGGTLALGAAAAMLAACGGGGSNNASDPPATPYAATTLVSDGSSPAAHTDPNLQNGWGIAFNPTGTFWVSDNTTNKSTLYDGNGVVQSLVVAIPAGSSGTAGNTGMIFNKATGFAVSSGGKSSNAVFMWATEGGTIAAWSPKVLPTQAVTVFDSGAGHANYKGLTQSSVNGQPYLYATDFHNARVDVFDTNFTKVQLSGQFQDPSIPSGFAPFGIQAIGTKIFVTYAMQNATASAQVVGAGLGILDEFDTSGNFIARLETNGGSLNAPWGIAQAPANYGPLSNDLLVGNFGDGTIEAFDPGTGHDLGKLTLSNGQQFARPGLWGLSFGNDVDNQPSNTLFYAAGPSKTQGVFGRIDATPAN
jgi:uncharacterized protein (TIGR03118 family)